MDANLLQTAIDFYNQGNSMTKTCKEFHTTPNTLKKLFLQQNIHIRNRTEQLIIENKRRAKKINHDYFSVLNNENSYYLGFLAADGTVRKDRNEIKIGLSAKDEYFLKDFQSKLNSEKEVHTYTNGKGFECSELIFTSFQIKQDIMKYGIVPNKTYIGISLKPIPEKFRLAFIKGFFDGDGSFSYNKNTKQAKVSFVSHTPEILEEIKLFFNSGNIYQDSRTLVYSLEFSTIPSLNIMKQFYELDTPFLKRKREKYLECLKLRDNIPRDKTSSDRG